MGEFGHDGGVDIWRVGEYKRVDRRLDGAGELLEHQMLILHLCDETTSLEQALTIPIECSDALRGCWHCGQTHQISQQPFVDKRQVTAIENGLLVVLDQPIMFGVEDGMDRSQANVFVATTIASDEVTIQQLIVIGADSLWQNGQVIGTNR
ncbi:hypothetical protein FQZ97_963040 [compost metagenome]